MEYTKAADDLSAYYEEILIDEYQDSNMLQEVILTAVSKGKYNEADNNIYMVGDVEAEHLQVPSGVSEAVYG